MRNKKDFNSQFATLKLREEIEDTEQNISEQKTIFSIDDQKIDDLFINNFPGSVDYLHDGSDVYYATDQNDLEKFVDYIESLGLDSDHIKLRTNFKEDNAAAAPVGNTTSNAGAYNASLNAPSKKQNPFKEGIQEYFIQVDIRDAKTALGIIDDSYTLSNTIKKRSSDVYTTFDAMAAEELVDSLKQNGINNKNNVVGYVDEDILSGYKKLTGFRAGHTSDKGGFQYKDLWGMNEAYDKSKIKTNADELARVQDMIKTATSSQIASQEDRIKKLKLLVSLEKKHNIRLPVLHYGTFWVDYLKDQGVKTPLELDTKLSTKKEDMNENIERDQKVKITKGMYAGNTATVHDFDSEKDIASGNDWVDVLIGAKKEKKTVKASELKPINENYARFRNETKTRTKPEQFHNAVKSVKQKIEEINKLYEYMERLKTELSEGNDGLKYKKYTESAIFKIKEAVKALHEKTKKLK